MSEKKSKTYMIFLYGIWFNESFVTKTVSNILLPLKSDGFVKFINGSFSSVITFNSEYSLEDINDTINDKLPELVNMMFIMEKPENMVYNMPQWLSDHLFNITETDDDSPHITRGNIIKDPLNPFGDLPEIENNMSLDSEEGLDDIMRDVSDALDKVMNRLEPTDKDTDMDLDEILDKLSKHGMDSLTQREKNFLEKYN